DADLHIHGLRPAAITGTANRSYAKIIQSDRDAHVGVRRGYAICSVERDPAQVGNMGFCPGMAGVLVDDSVHAVKVAADIARRNAQTANRGNKNVREVLTDATFKCEGLDRCRRRVGGISVEDDIAIYPRKHGMEEL